MFAGKVTNLPNLTKYNKIKWMSRTITQSSDWIIWTNRSVFDVLRLFSVRARARMCVCTRARAFVIECVCACSCVRYKVSGLSVMAGSRRVSDNRFRLSGAFKTTSAVHPPPPKTHTLNSVSNRQLAVRKKSFWMHACIMFCLEVNEALPRDCSPLVHISSEHFFFF